jgi:hypothetical protein
MRPKISLGATWGAPRFAYDEAFLLSWKASAGKSPGASPPGSASGPRKSIGISMLRLRSRPLGGKLAITKGYRMVNSKPLISLLFCCLLVSCQVQTTQEDTIDNQLRSIPPSGTYTAEPTPSIAPTATSSPTATSIIISPTWTPLPLVPTEDLQTFVSELLEDNTGCKLPCLWGIIPGETPWEEASQFLNTFAHTGYAENQAGFAAVRSPIGRGDESFTIQYSFLVTDGVITSIEFYNWPELSSWHYLSKILNDYGPPDEVGLYTEGKQYTGSRISSLILFYADPGFMIEYVSFRKVEAVGDKVLFCPEGNYSFIYMWSKGLDYSFDEAITAYPVVYESASPRPIGEVSNMDIQSFYHAFRDPNTNACIETDLAAWPHFLE